MKTAIFLSNGLYEKAEKTSSYMRIPRGKLFSMALEDAAHKTPAEIIGELVREQMLAAI